VEEDRGRTLSVWLLAVLTLALCLLAPARASAAGTHFFLEAFGSAEQPSFGEPLGMAVDQSTEDLLVIDGAAETVSRWNSDGTPSEFSAIGTNVISGLAFGSAGEVQVAVDNSGGPNDGNIYVPQAGTGVVEIFSSTGESIGQLTESSEGAFVEPCGVAVDPSGNVYVGDFSGQIHKFAPSANPPVDGDSSSNFPFESNCTLAAGAGPTDGFIFPVRFNGKVSKLDAVTGEEKYEVPGENTTVTVDPATGHVYVASGSAVNEYDFSGETEASLLSSFSAPATVTGIAVDSATSNVYVASAGNPNIEVYGPAVPLPEAVSEAATEVDQDSAVLHGTVSAAGGPETSCEFQYTTEAAFESEGFEGATSLPCVPPGPFAGSGDEAVSAEATGLTSGTAYRFRVVASNESGSVPGEALSFFTPGPPVIFGETASSIAATSARISAQINPVGAATTFVVQYVPEAEFLETEFDEAISVPQPPGEIDAGTEFEQVVQQLSGLAPQTTYHFRVVATNSVATVEGADKTFTTFSLPTVGLPDGRAYEMISPPQKAGEVIPPEPRSDLSESCIECLPGENKPTMPMQSAPDGESVLYEGQPFSGNLAAGPNEYISGRTSTEWTTGSLSSPTTTGRYEAFSSDLSRSVLAQTEPALSPEAPASEGVTFANLYRREQNGFLQPLVVDKPPHRDPGFPSFGGNQFRIRFAAANAGTASEPAFEHLVFEANDALTGAVAEIAPEAPEAEAGSECTFSKCNLYEWVDGQLRLVNVLPGNTSAGTAAVIGSGRLLGGINPEYEAPGVDHAISDDGSRVFWSDGGGGQVYVRVDGEETLEIPGPGLCKESVPREERVCFLTASSDGSEVLLSDGQIYALDEEGEAYEPAVDLAEGQEGFRGILGASEDLSRVYFVDTDALTPEGEENANGEHAEAGSSNLYAWNQGATSFIGALLASDNRFGQQARYGAWKAAPQNRTAQVSPDGGQLAFMSQASLTGYDSTLSGGGKCPLGEAHSCFEVFVYAADLQTLSCASCNPSGQQPIGPSNLSLLRPASPPGAGSPPYPQPGNLSTAGGGRLFFESQDILSPQDVNGDVQDVYEWEPNGVGSCERPGGCMFLISSGHSANDSMFLDSTPSGNDAFFITRERLLPRDKDEQLDLYDARVGGGFEEIVNAPCGGDACRGPIESPSPQQTAGTPGFSGPVNPKPKPACKKGFVKKHGKCVKKKHKKHHKRSAKRNRGGSR
jgi:outer membrane protein assembly factor BamB